MTSIVEREQARRWTQKQVQDFHSLRPATVSRPDRITWYCDVKTLKFQVGCCKILLHYANGDATVLTRNGVQFTATATEVYNLRKGDYHEAPDL